MKKLLLFTGLFGLVLLVGACAPQGPTIALDPPEAPANDNPTLVVHYNRFDEEYGEWNLWLWPNEPVGLEGEAYMFTEETDYGVMMRLDLTTTNMADSTRIGIIVRTNNWDKDVAEDRFIDLTFDENNEMHVYLVQANSQIFYSLETVDTTAQIFSARFINDNVIEVRTTSPAGDASNIKILADGEEYPIDTVYPGGTIRRIQLEGDVDLSKRFTVEINFGEYSKTKQVELTGLYTSDRFNELYAYDGDLGVIYTPTQTTFRLWAPVSDEVTLHLYTHGHPTRLQTDTAPGVDTPYDTIEMTPDWSRCIQAVVNGLTFFCTTYYTFDVNGHEVVDPYAYGVWTPNGLRGLVVDFSRTNPEGWDTQTTSLGRNLTDTILYKLHVRDLTSHSSWNGLTTCVGTFLGLATDRNNLPRCHQDLTTWSNWV